MMIEDEVIEDKCPICLTNFDSTFKIPMMVCLQQHLCCKQCLTTSAETSNKFKCPLCRKTGLSLKQIKKFRYYFYFQDKVRSIKEAYQDKIQREMSRLYIGNEQTDKQTQQTLRLVTQGKFADFQNNFDQIVIQARFLLRYNLFKRASNLLQKIIERSPNSDTGVFIGLGSYQQSVGYYQNNISRWFQSKYSQKKVSVYDLLALCYLGKPNFQNQKNWYAGLIMKYPNNIKLKYGLAITLHNAQRYEQAQIIYIKITQINPQFSKAWQMLGFIQHYRLNRQKSLQYAKKCLFVDSRNIYAKYLVASYLLTQNDSNINAQQQICSMYDSQLEYVRPFYQLGLYFYYQQNNSQRALYYWNKCYKINPHFYDPLIRKAELLINTNTQQQGISIIKSIYRKAQLRNQQQQLCNVLLGKAYYLIKEYTKAINCLNKYFSDFQYYKNIYLFSLLLESLFQNQQDQKARKLCQSALDKYFNNHNLSEMCSSFMIKISFANNQYEQTISQIKLYQQKKYVRIEEHYYMMAKCYFQIGKLDSSKNWCQYCISNKIQCKQVKRLKQKVIAKIKDRQKSKSKKKEYRNKDEKSCRCKYK